MFVYTDIITKNVIAGGMFAKNMYSAQNLRSYPRYGASLALLLRW